MRPLLLSNVRLQKTSKQPGRLPFSIYDLPGECKAYIPQAGISTTRLTSWRLLHILVHSSFYYSVPFALARVDFLLCSKSVPVTLFPVVKSTQIITNHDCHKLCKQEKYYFYNNLHAWLKDVLRLIQLAWHSPLLQGLLHCCQVLPD